jgi:hypothetical protein
MNCSAAHWIPCTVLFLSVSAAQSPPRPNAEYSRQVSGAPTTESVHAAHLRGTPHKTGQSLPKQNIQAVPATVSEPARVTLQHGVLTVSAHDSDLSQILTEVAQTGGMTIDGAIQSVKVFGRYGPGNSRDVLTDLLRGLGYNFIMVGETSQGAPRELLLTPRTGSATPPSSPELTNSQPQRLNSDGTVVDENHPGPGAVVDVPPPPSDDSQERSQQHLQRLERMHEPQQLPTPPQ